MLIPRVAKKKPVSRSPKLQSPKDEVKVEECEVDDMITASDNNVDDSNPDDVGAKLDGINKDDLVSDAEEEKQECLLNSNESVQMDTTEMKEQPGFLTHTAKTQRIESKDEISTTGVNKKPAGMETDKVVLSDDHAEAEIPEVLSTLGLTVSPKSSNKNSTSSSSSPVPDDPSSANQEAGAASEEAQVPSEELPVGKLRSSVADAEGNRLVKGYRHGLREANEYALNYICTEFHHPVITSFRELTKSDISTIVGSGKLKKSCNSLEQSVIYLGLIDLLATVNNNPFYGESGNGKFSKTVSNSVQKILLEFKNIIGLWALSGNENLSSRYVLVLRYLRQLVPMFKRAGFDEKFGNILDCIEKEVQRCKMNQEKLKSMNSSENSVDKKMTSDSQDGDPRSALNEIVLNVNLHVKDDDSDDDDVTMLSEEKVPQIFGKPLKAKTTEGKKPRKSKKSTDPSGLGKKSGDNNVLKTPTSHAPVKAKNLPKPKTLASAFQSTSSPKSTSSKPALPLDKSSKTAAVKRNANEELTNGNESSKKMKLDESPDQANPKEQRGIKNFFQVRNASPDNAESVNKTKEPVASPSVAKPAVNAFALMMNRSREMAQKKKLDKPSTSQRPTVKT
ncbi:hypothetical protein Ocin01_01662 [Orchesella cincta]|uniref:Uncharacterized protein n=1 Tax=Orchesella cincta TaxID=48709 RepID=A0A1D2NIB1_ORCCI|nr:hypothetical protein Ocin01_01662 [Orchesella cincta]